MRWLAPLLLLLALLSAPLAAQEADPQQTERDRDFLTRLIEDNLSGASRQVQIFGFRGALSSRATFERLTIADDIGIWLTIEDAELDWNRSALFSRRLEVEALTAGRIVLERIPSTGGGGAGLPRLTARDIALPDLPVAIDIGRIAAGSLELGAAVLGEAVTARFEGTGALEDGTGSASLLLERTDGKEGRASIEAAFSKETRLLSLDIDAREAAGGVVARLLDLPGAPALGFRLAGSAPLDDWRAEIALQTGGQTQVAGAVTLSDGGEGGEQRFGLTLAGDLRPFFTPEYQRFFGAESELEVAGALLAAGGLELEALLLVTEQLRLEGTLATAEDGLPTRFDLTGALQPSGAEGVLLPFGETGLRLVAGGIRAGYDQAQGESWSLTGSFTGLRSGEVYVAGGSLEGAGTIGRDAEGRGSATGNLALDVAGIETGEVALDAATAGQLQAAFDFGWSPGEPLNLTDAEIAAGPTRLTGSVSISGASQNFRLTGEGDLQAPQLNRFAGLRGGPLAGAAQARLAGWFEPLGGAFDLDVDARTTDLAAGQGLPYSLFAGDTAITGGIARSTTGIAADALTIDAPRLDATFDGGFGTEDGALRLTVRLEDMADLGVALSGPLELAGRLERVDERLELDLDLGGPGGITATVVGRAAGDLSTADLTFQARMADLAPVVPRFPGPVAAEGSLQLRGEGMELDVTASTPPGADLRLTGTATADLTRANLDIDLRLADLAALSPRLSGPATLTGAVGRDGAQLSFDLDAAAPEPGLTASLAGGAPLDLSTLTAEVSARLTTLSTFFPGIKGAATAQGTIGRAAGRIQLDLAGTALGSASYRAEGSLAEDLSDAALTLDATLPLALAQPFVPGVTLSGTATLDAALNGPLALDSLAATLSTGDGAVALDGIALEAIRGGVTLAPDDRQAGDTLAARIAIDSAALVAPGQAWAPLVRNPVGLTALARLMPEALVLTDIALTDAGGSVTGTATIPTGDGPIAADLDADLSAARFSALLGIPAEGRIAAALTASFDAARGDLAVLAEGTTSGLAFGGAPVFDLLEGSGSFAAELARQDGAVTIRTARLQTPALTVSATGGQGGALRLEAALDSLARLVPQLPGPVRASGTVTPDASGAALDLSASGPGGSSLSISGRAATSGDLALAISGTVPLGLASAFTGPAVDARGPVQLDLRLDGRPSLSSLSGTARTSDAQVVLPGPAVALENVTATATLAGGTARIEATAAPREGGSIAVQGSIGLAAPFAVDLRLAIAQMIYTMPPTLRTTFDADLALTGALLGGGTLSGQVTLDETTVNLAFAGGGSDLSGVEHVAPAPDVQATRRRAGLLQPEGSGGPSGTLALDVTINAPNRIFIRGRGLDAELGGTLQITGRAGNVVPIGAFELIRGRLDLLGQRLDLVEGQLLLQGSLDPTVRLVAETRAEDVTVQIITEGSATAPVVTLISTPDLPDEEILSLLIFGRDFTSISPIQALQLANAVRTLLGSGGEGLQGDIRRQFGLDDLDVTTDADGNLALRAGAYISENAYADVTVNAEGEAQIELNLDITPSLTARGRVSSTGETGLGIYFERDY